MGGLLNELEQGLRQPETESDDGEGGEPNPHGVEREMIDAPEPRIRKKSRDCSKQKKSRKSRVRRVNPSVPLAPFSIVCLGSCHFRIL